MIGFHHFTNVIILAILGLAMHILLRLWRMGSRDDASLFQVVLRLVAWCCILVGSLAWLIGVSVVLSFILVPGAIVLFMVTYARHRQGENRLMLSVLSSAMEHDIPLSTISYAYASECSGESGDRARKFSRLLASGVDLIAAAREAAIRLPEETRMAYVLGQEYGGLGVLMREVNHFSARWKQHMQPLWDRLLAVGFVGLPTLAFFVGIQTFVMLKIVPTFKQIFDDFELELPAMTQLGMLSADAFATYFPFFILVLFPINCLLFFALVLFMLNYLGWIDYYPFGLRWLKGPVDSSKVLTLLACGIEKDIPLTDLLLSMGQYWPKHRVAQMLKNAYHQISTGGDWLEALRKDRLITKNEAAVLRSAQEVGNLPWAMREVADSKLRRHAVRILPWTHVFVAGFVIVIGLQVGFFVIAMFLPLVDLIQNMTG
ncbi:MAG: hypothetical protein COA78_24610 [Blastopirellula sp.]|nr:MAG: hypothetical protein COA78_24610 [Blastopirellula sp.]